MKTMRHFSIACSLLLLIASCTSAPATTDETQGDFNALDPSLTCNGTDQVGWNFSTGGGGDSDVHDWGTSNEIQIVDATYGASCSVDVGNWTSTLAKSCNGFYSCSRYVLATGDVDPSKGCAKDFKAHYRCGIEPTVYEVSMAAPASSALTISCGQKITIASAVFGDACAADVGANFTMKLRDTCSGLRHCTPGQSGRTMAGATPAASCGTSTTVKYQCGTSSSLISKTFADGVSLDFDCPAGQTMTPPSVTGIRIDHATYGGNCQNTAVLQDNFFAQAASKCTGQTTCGATGPLLGPTDPSPGCEKNIDIAYHCGDDLTPKTVHVAGEAGGRPWSLTCSPEFHIQSATFGANCGAPIGNATVSIGTICASTGGSSCQIKPTSALGDPYPNCQEELAIKYSCGPDPTVISKSFTDYGDGIVIQCLIPDVPYAKKACIPKQCVGTERRDASMNCVKDLTLPIVPAFDTTDGSVLYYSDSGHSGYYSQATNLTIGEDALHGWGVAIKATSALPGKAGDPLGESAIWIKDTFQKSDGTGDKVYGFRCSIGYVTMRRLDPASPPVFVASIPAQKDPDRFLVGEIVDSILPRACFDNNPPSWRDAAKRLGVAESDFRSTYKLVGNGSSINVSYDPRGRVVALRDAAKTADTALAPNPIGFYYDPTKLWVNFIEYFNQTLVPVMGMSQITLQQSNDIALAAESAQLRNLEMDLSLFDTGPQRELEINFNWTKSGDSPGRNPFSSVGAPLSSSVKTITQQHLGATVEIAAATDYDAGLQTNGWVSSAKSLALGSIGATVLGVGSAAGEYVRIVAPMTEAVRQRVFRATTDNYGWLVKPTDSTVKFRIRVCLDIGDYARSDGFDDPYAGPEVKQGTTKFTAKFKGKRCVVADQIGVITRRYEKAPFGESSKDTDGSVGVSADQGNKTAGSQNDMGSLQTCARACTVNADCGTGQTCTIATGLTIGACSGAGANNACTNKDSNSMATSGMFGVTLFDTQTTSGQRWASDGMETSVSSKSKALGFTVLDSGNGKTEKAKFDPDADWQGKESWKLDFSPNWDLIAALLQGEWLAMIASPVQAKFLSKEIEKGIQGLGVGIGRDFSVPIGVVPIIISVSAGVGLGLGVGLEIAASPPSGYPCLNKTGNCFQVSTDMLSLKDAALSCYRKGGYLAEILSVDDFSALKAVGTEKYWIGAQSTYRYPTPDCAVDNPSAACIAASQTLYKWLGNGGTFAAQNNTDPTLLTPDAYTAYSGFSNAALTTLTSQIPQLSGVVYSGASQTLLAVPVTQQSKYVCEFPPAASASSSKMSVGLKIGASAGVNFSACTPSTNAGLCIVANLNFISVEFDFNRVVQKSQLFDANYKPMLTVGSDSFEIKYEGSLLEAAIALELKLVFFTVRWEIFKAKALNLGTKTLTGYDHPIWRKF